MFSASLNQIGTSALEWSKSEIFIPLFLLGTLFVIVGVFMERDGFPDRVVAWGWTILIWGLAMELFGSIGQLAIDGEIGNRQRSEIFALEGVSNAQQSTIIRLENQNIDLERMLLPRGRYGPLAGSMRGAPTATSLFFDMDIESKLYSFAGKVSAKVQYAARDDEAARLADQIKSGLSVARWSVSDLTPEQSRIPYVGEGVQLWTSPEHGAAFDAAEALEQSLKLEGIQAESPDRPLHRYDPKGLRDGDIRKSLSPDTMVILVGTKPGYLDMLGKEAAAYREAHPGEK